MVWLMSTTRSSRSRKMVLRTIEPKSFGIAMGNTTDSAGYTKSYVKRVERTNSCMLPIDDKCGSCHGVTFDNEEVVKCRTGWSVANQWREQSKLPQSALPKASSVKDDYLEKEQMKHQWKVSTATYNAVSQWWRRRWKWKCRISQYHSRGRIITRM